ncbi:hypothetical protein ACFX2F_025748 [Malus domestica]
MDKGFERVDPLRGGDDAISGRNLNAFRPGLAVNDHRVDFMLLEAPMVREKLDDEACLAGRNECTMDGHLENLRQAEGPSGVLVGQRGRMCWKYALKVNL